MTYRLKYIFYDPSRSIKLEVFKVYTYMKEIEITK